MKIVYIYSQRITITVYYDFWCAWFVCICEKREKKKEKKKRKQDASVLERVRPEKEDLIFLPLAVCKIWDLTDFSVFIYSSREERYVCCIYAWLLLYFCQGFLFQTRKWFSRLEKDREILNAHNNVFLFRLHLSMEIQYLAKNCNENKEFYPKIYF